MSHRRATKRAFNRPDPKRAKIIGVRCQRCDYADNARTLAEASRLYRDHHCLPR